MKVVLFLFRNIWSSQSACRTSTQDWTIPSRRSRRWMLGNPSLPSWTFTEVWEGRLASRLVLCVTALTRARRPPQQEPAITTPLKTRSTAFTIHTLVPPVTSCRRTAVAAAGWQMHLFRVTTPTITHASLVGATCRWRQLTTCHSVSLRGSAFLKSDLLVSGSYHKY